MTAVLTEQRVGSKPIEVAYWIRNEAGQTAASTSIHSDFLTLLSMSEGGKVLDIGCGSGRGSRELAHLGYDVVGVDPNRKELTFGNRQNDGIFIPYIEAFGQQLPIATSSADSAILLAVLGAVEKNTREDILKDSIRCTKPNGLIYIAEFAMISDPTVYTSTGKRWVDVYQQDVELIGEFGSVIVQNEDGSRRFIGHHFTETELTDLMGKNGVMVLQTEKIQVQSKVSGLTRDNWNIWGYKQ